MNRGGRPKGPPKTHFCVWVLPETRESISREAFRKSTSNGAVIDSLAKRLSKKDISPAK